MALDIVSRRFSEEFRGDFCTHIGRRRQLDRPMILILKDVNAETDLKWHQACVEAGTEADIIRCHHRRGDFFASMGT